MKKIVDFYGGIYPPDYKAASTQQPILAAPLPSQLIVPLRQSIGSSPKCLVAVGDRVKKGQKIAEADGVVSVATHAPTSGKIAAIGDYIVAHPSGLPDRAVVIIPDGDDQWLEREPVNLSVYKSHEIRDYLQEMGIVGLGGAVFPTHLKLHTQVLETLVINGAECEPYITCDEMLMRERAEGILAGIELLYPLINPNEVLIGIEDNKPEAISAMQQACAKYDGIAQVVVVPTRYPSGGAKQLIKMLTNKEIPSGRRSTEFGVQCFNVATIYAIYRALTFAEPVISRVVTVTGNVKKPANYEVLIGTPLNELVALAEPEQDTDGYLMGGPMMGFRVPAFDVPVAKASNCFIATSFSLFPPSLPALPCIRCGKCAEVCPAKLQPQDIYWFTKAKNLGKAQELALFDCIECGACAYVCPSKLPLVDYYRFAKSEIWAAQAQKKAADHARERYEFRLLRLERERLEKATRLAAKAALKQDIASYSTDPADRERAAKIKAAMQKAAARKAVSDPTAASDPTAQISAAEKATLQQEKIAAAIVRVAQRKASALIPDTISPKTLSSNETDDKSEKES